MRLEVDMNIEQVNRLFELTELHMSWFNRFYPNDTPPFHILLKKNHDKIKEYIKFNLMGDYVSDDIDNKLFCLFDAYNSLIEITYHNRNQKDINNDLVY